LTAITLKAIFTFVKLTLEQLDELRRAPLEGENKIKVALALTGVTQVALAAGIRRTQAYVSELENGKYRLLPLETSRAVARFFGASIEDIFPAREELRAS
jgi:DNA-binding XRE family transcriptional regulator